MIEGLTLANRTLGPLPILGWVRGGTRCDVDRGGVRAAVVLCIVLGLAAFYLRFGGLSWMRRPSTALALQ